MNNDKIITIKVSEFTTLPGARYVADGDGSAEEFFNDFFKPQVEKNPESNFLLDFDNTWGYASSFVSELAKDIKVKYGVKFINNNLTFKSDEDRLLIERFKNELQQEY